jgi:hypothetical protein
MAATSFPFSSTTIGASDIARARLISPDITICPVFASLQAHAVFITDSGETLTSPEPTLPTSDTPVEPDPIGNHGSPREP